MYHPGLQRLFAFPCNDWLQVTDAEGLEGCKKKLMEGSLAAAGECVLCVSEFGRAEATVRVDVCVLSKC